MSTLTYALDLTGLAAANLIVNEHHVLSAVNAPLYATLVPLFPPFYAADCQVTITDGDHQRLLTPGVEYYLVAPVEALTQVVRQPVYTAIAVNTTAITGMVFIQYRTVGGPWAVNRHAVLEALAEKNYNPRMVDWSQIIDVPTCFPPQLHYQSFDTLCHQAPLQTVLQTLVTALQTPLEPDVLDRHILDLDNPHHTTLEDLGVTVASSEAIALREPSDAILTVAGLRQLWLETPQTPPTQPQINQPVATQQNAVTPWCDATAVIQTTPFVAHYGTAAHVASSWHMATDATFITLVAVNAHTITDLTAWSVTDLLPNTTYFIRVCHESAAGHCSPWSAPIQIQTGEIPTVADIIIATPAITTPTDAAVVTSAQTTVFSSAFALESGIDSHVSSDWQLATDTDFLTVVASATGDTVAKTAWSVICPVTETEYYVRVRYCGSSGNMSAWSEGRHFTASFLTLPSNEIAKLIAPDPVASGYFGDGLALSRDGITLCIGASYAEAPNSSRSGAVYTAILDGTGWGNLTKLTPEVPTTSDNFGLAIALSTDGTTLCVGAYGTDIEDINRSGAAFIYRRVGAAWVEEATLVPQTLAVFGSFGYSVSLSGNGQTACVGSSFDDTLKGENSGSVSIYTRSNAVWSRIAYLLATDGVANGMFGHQVALSADGLTLCVGSPTGINNADIVTGAVYVFIWSAGGWAQQAKLVANNATVGHWFGSSIALSDDGQTVCIGAVYAAAGAAYIFEKTDVSWQQTAFLQTTTPTYAAEFGRAVSLSATGDLACVGEKGAAFLFKKQETEWVLQTKVVAEDPVVNDDFGYTVALTADGTKLCIGARYVDINALNNTGAVYVFS